MEISLKAFIDEENCIGCVKCIRICPTDAIVGAKRMLHTILPDLCTACSNCIQACPTDCISLATKWPAMTFDRERELTEKKQKRLGLFGFSASVMQMNNQAMKKQEQQAHSIEPISKKEIDRKQQIAEMIARAQLKRQSLQK